MNKRRLSIDEIRDIVIPVARAYGVERVALFGSYARGDAKLSSDVDLHVDKGSIKGLFRLAGFQRELEEGLSVHCNYNRQRYRRLIGTRTQSSITGFGQ